MCLWKYWTESTVLQETYHTPKCTLNWISLALWDSCKFNPRSNLKNKWSTTELWYPLLIYSREMRYSSSSDDDGCIVQTGAEDLCAWSKAASQALPALNCLHYWLICGRGRDLSVDQGCLCVALQIYSSECYASIRSLLPLFEYIQQHFTFSYQLLTLTSTMTYFVAILHVERNKFSCTFGGWECFFPPECLLFLSTFLDGCCMAWSLGEPPAQPLMYLKGICLFSKCKCTLPQKTAWLGNEQSKQFKRVSTTTPPETGVVHLLSLGQDHLLSKPLKEYPENWMNVPSTQQLKWAG